MKNCKMLDLSVLIDEDECSEESGIQSVLQTLILLQSFRIPHLDYLKLMSMDNYIVVLIIHSHYMVMMSAGKHPASHIILDLMKTTLACNLYYYATRYSPLVVQHKVVTEVKIKAVVATRLCTDIVTSALVTTVTDLHSISQSLIRANMLRTETMKGDSLSFDVRLPMRNYRVGSVVASLFVDITYDKAFYIMNLKYYNNALQPVVFTEKICGYWVLETAVKQDEECKWFVRSYGDRARGMPLYTSFMTPSIAYTSLYI
ncbi:hypothetical protein EON65_46995, partial [archaeon]